jgi:hypothetical protein
VGEAAKVVPLENHRQPPPPRCASHSNTRLASSFAAPRHATRHAAPADPRPSIEAASSARSPSLRGQSTSGTPSMKSIPKDSARPARATLAPGVQLVSTRLPRSGRTSRTPSADWQQPSAHDLHPRAATVATATMPSNRLSRVPRVPRQSYSQPPLPLREMAVLF